MRLQERKLLTTVNAWFLNNKPKAGRKKQREDTRWPNNSILKAMFSLWCNEHFSLPILYLHIEEETQVSRNCEVRKNLFDKYKPQIWSPLHPFVYLLLTHSDVPFNSERSCYEKKERAAGQRRGSPGKSTLQQQVLASGWGEHDQIREKKKYKAAEIAFGRGHSGRTCKQGQNWRAN